MKEQIDSSFNETGVNTRSNGKLIMEFFNDSAKSDYLRDLSEYHRLLVTSPENFTSEFRSNMDSTFRSVFKLIEGLTSES